MMIKFSNGNISRLESDPCNSLRETTTGREELVHGQVHSRMVGKSKGRRHSTGNISNMPVPRATTSSSGKIGNGHSKDGKKTMSTTSKIGNGHSIDTKKTMSTTTSTTTMRKISECEQLELTEEHYWDRLGMIVDHPHCSICRQNLRVS